MLLSSVTQLGFVFFGGGGKGIEPRAAALLVFFLNDADVVAQGLRRVFQRLRLLHDGGEVA